MLTNTKTMTNDLFSQAATPTQKKLTGFTIPASDPEFCRVMRYYSHRLYAAGRIDEHAKISDIIEQHLKEIGIIE